MKKLFSALIILATVLALALSLISCSPDKEEAAKKAAVTELYSQAEQEPAPAWPRTNQEVLDIIYSLEAPSTYERIYNLTDAPDTLLALYRNNDFFVAYTKTSSAYVDVETEGLTWFTPDGTVVYSTILTWTVGHGEDFGDFPGGFVGYAGNGIYDVELVSGATATSEHYRDAVSEASLYVIDFSYSGYSFTEEQIKDFIYGWTGNYASLATTDGFTPDNTVGLFRLDNDWYAAYIVTPESYYSPKTEAIIRFQPYSFDYETYCMIGDASTYEFSSAALEAISYANNLELGSDVIENLANEIVLKNFGYASNMDIHQTHEGGVEYIFYERTHGVHVVYIDTKVLDQTHYTYIKALVLYQGASNIIDIQPIAFDFTAYNTYETQPSYDDVIAFLDQFRGYYGLEDTARYESIYGYEEACNYFFNAMRQAHKCVQEFTPTGFEAWVSETFGPDSSPVLVVVGLVVSIIMSLIVLTVIFLPVALVPILLAIILMLFIIILILVISKIKLKKRVKKLALEVSSKKAESAEATDEGAATEGAEGENA